MIDLDAVQDYLKEQSRDDLASIVRRASWIDTYEKRPKTKAMVLGYWSGMRAGHRLGLTRRVKDDEWEDDLGGDFPAPDFWMSIPKPPRF